MRPIANYLLFKPGNRSSFSFGPLPKNREDEDRTPRADLIGISDAGTCVNLGTKFTLGASCNGLWCFPFLLSASVACVWTYNIDAEL